jgi:hypothetical protein
MDPEAVAGQEVGDGGDGQRLAGAGDADVDARADQVKAGVGVGHNHDAWSIVAIRLQHGDEARIDAEMIKARRRPRLLHLET